MSVKFLSALGATPKLAMEVDDCALQNIYHLPPCATSVGRRAPPDPNRRLDDPPTMALTIGPESWPARGGLWSTAMEKTGGKAVAKPSPATKKATAATAATGMNHPRRPKVAAAGRERYCTSLTLPSTKTTFMSL
jgi:hypothetical protein